MLLQYPMANYSARDISSVSIEMKKNEAAEIMQLFLVIAGALLGNTKYLNTSSA